MQPHVQYGRGQRTQPANHVKTCAIYHLSYNIVCPFKSYHLSYTIYQISYRMLCQCELLGPFMGTALWLLRLLAISCLRRLPRAHPGRLPRAHPSPKKERLWLAGPAWPAHTPITSHPHHPPLFTLSAESAEITTAPSHHPHVTTRPIITHAHITLATTHTQLTTISIKIQTNHSVGVWLRQTQAGPVHNVFGVWRHVEARGWSGCIQRSTEAGP